MQDLPVLHPEKPDLEDDILVYGFLLFQHPNSREKPSFRGFLAKSVANGGFV